MKKFTLLAAMAAAALSMSAQYAVTPGIADFKSRVEPCEIAPFVLAESLVNDLTAAGYTFNNGMVLNNETVNWYWWAGWTTGDDSYPDPDFSGEGYIAQTVTGDAGWSGGGTNIQEAAGFNNNFTDESVLHITLRSVNQPASLGMILLDGADVGGAAAKLAFGDAAFDDNGVIYPLVGPMPKDGDWACYEIKFSDIKKMWPGFNNINMTGWNGNAFIFLSGNVAGTDFGVCESFVYTPASAGVEGIAADAQNGPAVYFNLQGQRVDNPQSGLFIMRQGNKATKVIL